MPIHDPTAVDARKAILAALPSDGGTVGYAAIGLAGGDQAGAIVGDLLAEGLVEVVTVEGALRYRRIGN